MNERSNMNDEYYGYDYLNRVKAMDRGTLNGNKDAIEGTPVKEEDYTLDASGNWNAKVNKTSGTTDLDQTRGHSKANEISSIGGTPTWATPVQDAVGDMTTLPKPSAPTGSYTAKYDAWNRLVELKEGENTAAKYKYDGMDRRIVKETYSGGSLSETRHFYYSNLWQIVEERVGTSTNPERQYVWGLRYVDELICQDRDTNADGTLDQRMYALQDANFNVTALVDTSGAVQERYVYTPYGTRTVLDGSWGGRSSSSYGWVIGHQGLMHDTESGLVYNRMRYLHTELGRFLQRDPVGYIGGANLYEYVRGSPIVAADPIGLWKDEAGRAECWERWLGWNVNSMTSEMKKLWYKCSNELMGKNGKLPSPNELCDCIVKKAGEKLQAAVKSYFCCWYLDKVEVDIMERDPNTWSNCVGRCSFDFCLEAFDIAKSGYIDGPALIKCDQKLKACLAKCDEKRSK